MSLSANQNRALIAGVICLALVGVLVVYLDWENVKDSVAAADWRPMLGAMAVSFLSYVFACTSYALLNRSAGINLHYGTLIGVGFVSSAMISAIGGVAGHSLRLMLMARRGVRAGDTLAPSFFHGYMESVIFFLLVPSGLIYLALSHPLPEPMATTAVAGAVVLGVGFCLTALALFVHPVRERVLRGVGWLWRKVTRRKIDRGLADFENTLRQGMAAARERPLSLALPVALVALDRLSRVAVMWLCFEALGGGAPPEVVLTGFSIGVAVGVMSMVPAGLGVQEASMSGIYHLLGAPLEQAVLASLLFRVVYSFIPFGLSLSLYGRALRSRRTPLRRSHEGGNPGG